MNLYNMSFNAWKLAIYECIIAHYIHTALELD